MKILLPVDGTELSLHETRFALHLVRQGLNASFVLANVQEPASFYEIVTAHDPALIKDVAMEAAEELMAPSARLLQEAGVPFETAFISDNPVQGMLDLIELHHCEMVLMGSRALGPPPDRRRLGLAPPGRGFAGAGAAGQAAGGGLTGSAIRPRVVNPPVTLILRTV